MINGLVNDLTFQKSTDSSSKRSRKNIIHTLDTPLDIHIHQNTVFHEQYNITDKYCFAFPDCSYDDLKEIFYEICECFVSFHNSSVLSLYLPLNLKYFLIEVKVGADLKSIISKYKYSYRLPNPSRVLQPDQMLFFFCNPIRLDNINPGRIGYTINVDNSKQYFQVVSRDYSKFLVLVKHYPLIDYAKLRDHGLTSQKALNRVLGPKYRPPPSKFIRDAISLSPKVFSTRSIWINEESVEMTLWDDELFYEDFQYEWVPLNVIYLHGIVLSMNEYSVFQKGVTYFEEKVIGFVDNMKIHMPIVKQSTKSIQPMSIEEAQEQFELSKMRLAQKEEQKRILIEKKMLRSSFIPGEPVEVTDEYLKGLLCQVKGYHMNDVVAEILPMPISGTIEFFHPLSYEQEEKWKSELAEQSNIVISKRMEMSDSGTQTQYASFNECSIQTQCDILPPTIIKTAKYRRLDLLDTSHGLVVVLDMNYPVLNVKTLDNDTINIDISEIKRIAYVQSRVFDIDGFRIVISDKAKIVSGKYIGNVADVKHLYNKKAFIVIKQMQGTDIFFWIDGFYLSVKDFVTNKTNGIKGRRIILYNQQNKQCIVECVKPNGCILVVDQNNNEDMIYFVEQGVKWDFVVDKK